MAVHDQQGRTFLPRTRKTRALLAVLALAPSKPVLRLHLASLLWSSREKDQARASLRQSVHELQDTLGCSWSHLFIADRHHLMLHGSALKIDVPALTQPTEDAANILDRFKDILLEDLNGLDPAFDRWLEEERARLIRIGRGLGETLLARCQDPALMIATAEQLLAVDRTHEGAWRAIMRAHAERGDRGAAMTTYDRCRFALAADSSTLPSPETEDLTIRIRDDRQSIAASARMFDAPVVASPSASTRAGIPHDGLALRLCIAPLRTIGEEVDDGLAAGLAEEISAALSRFRWISCVPATFWQGTPGGSAADATWAGHEGDLVLDVTVQRAAKRIRIIARLTDMRGRQDRLGWPVRPRHD